MIWRKRLFNIFVPTVVIFAQRPSLRSTGCLTITMTRSWSLSRSRKWSWKRIFVYIEDRVCYRWKLANRAWFWESYWRGEADSCDSCMWSTSLRLWWLEGGVWEARERAIREGEGEEGKRRTEGKRREGGWRKEGGRGRKEGRKGREEGRKGRDQINYRRKPFSDKWWSCLWQLIFLYYTNRCFVYQPNKSHSICSIHCPSDLLPSSLLFYSACFASLRVHIFQQYILLFFCFCLRWLLFEFCCSIEWPYLYTQIYTIVFLQCWWEHIFPIIVHYYLFAIELSHSNIHTSVSYPPPSSSLNE